MLPEVPREVITNGTGPEMYSVYVREAFQVRASISFRFEIGVSRLPMTRSASSSSTTNTTCESLVRSLSQLWLSQEHSRGPAVRRAVVPGVAQVFPYSLTKEVFRKYYYVLSRMKVGVLTILIR